MSAVADFLVEDAKRIREKIRAMMPPDCEMDEMDWLNLQTLKEYSGMLLSGITLKNMDVTQETIGWK